MSKGPGSDDTISDGTTENLDKVRDILFGAQMRDQDKRFARLEEKLGKEIADVRDQLLKRLGSLEEYFKGEVDGLVERIKGESTARSAAIREVNGELSALTKAHEKAVAELESKLGDAQRELRKALLDQSKSLRDEVQSTQQTVMSALERHVSALRAEKTDRHALADLLTEVALKLKGEFKMPKN